MAEALHRSATCPAGDIHKVESKGRCTGHALMSGFAMVPDGLSLAGHVLR